MKYLCSRMTLFVILALFTGLAAEAKTTKKKKAVARAAAVPVQATVAPPPASPVSYSFTMMGQKTAGPGAKAVAILAAGAEYGFYKTYSLGVEAAYGRILTDQRLETMTDVELTGRDGELWANKPLGLSLSGWVTALFPTSEASKISSMQWGARQGLRLKKTFSDRFWMSYSPQITEYSYYYDTAYWDEETEIYNTSWLLENRFMSGYSFTRDFRIKGGGWLASYQTTNGKTANTLFGTFSTSYDLSVETSINFQVIAGFKRKGEPPIWDGPALSHKFLGGEGVMFRIFTTISI